MIEYVSEYNKGEKPYICKKFTASSGEESHTSININSTNEIENLSLDLIYTHLDAVIKYISDTSDSLTVLKIDENINHHPWPIKNWENIEWAKEEVVVWWRYIYFKDIKDRESVIPEEPLNNNLDTNHSHEGVENHSHD